MSKGPTPRHSKSPKPVTIDLDATDVTPKNEGPKPKSSATGPAVSPSPDPADKADGTSAKAEAGPKSDPKIAGAAADPKQAAGSASAEKPEAGKADTGQAAAGKTDPGKADSGTGGDKPKQTPPPAGAGAATASPASRGGGMGMVVSGLIGAVIALGGGYALQVGGVLPAPNSGSEQATAMSSQIESLSARIDSVSQQIAESGATGGTGVPADLAERLDSLEAGLAEARAAGAGGGDPEVLDALEQRLASLEQSGGAAAADPALASQINELTAAQEGVQSALSELRSQAEALSGRISKLESSQQELAGKIDAPSRQIDLARAIAATGLKSAIDRGGPFMAELEAFASVAPEDPAVPELRDLAASGVPSRAELVEGFSEAASKAIAAADPGDPDAGLVDRLMSSAMSVVKVRKVGDVQGDGAEAIVARTETRLLNGNLDAAVAEWSTLPEASQAATAEFGEALRARARAEKLVASAMTPAAAPSTETPAN